MSLDKRSVSLREAEPLAPQAHCNRALQQVRPHKAGHGLKAKCSKVVVSEEMDPTGSCRCTRQVVGSCRGDAPDR